MPAFALPGPARPYRAGAVLGWLARGILSAATAFWLFFCVADGLGDARESGIVGFIMMLPAAVICLGALYVVFRWEYAGAYLLLGISLLGAFFVQRNMVNSSLPSASQPGQLAGLLLIMVLPFLIPGILLFIKHALERRSATQ